MKGNKNKRYQTKKSNKFKGIQKITIQSKYNTKRGNKNKRYQIKKI